MTAFLKIYKNFQPAQTNLLEKLRFLQVES